jgi:hypothetical protein
MPTSPSERQLRAELAEAEERISRLTVLLVLAGVALLSDGPEDLPPGFREWVSVALDIELKRGLDG